MRFIPASVWKWWAIKRFFSEFPSSPFPQIGDVSYRFVLAWYYYTARYNENLKDARDG